MFLMFESNMTTVKSKAVVHAELLNSTGTAGIVVVYGSFYKHVPPVGNNSINACERLWPFCLFVKDWSSRDTA